VIQTAVACPDPLATVEEDYGAAVLRLAWAVDRRNKDRVLLCAAVELVPNEVPAPDTSSEICATVSPRFSVYARHMTITVRRALAWFEDAAMGTALRPTSQGTLPPNVIPDAPTFVVGALEREPPGPAMLVPTTRVPFAADWHHSARVRQLVPDASPLAAWTTEERARATAWLREQCHLDFEVLPEFAGSIHLIAPNPVFRESFLRYEVDEHGRHQLTFAVKPRTGRSAAGLELVIEEQRATGAGVLARVILAAPIVRVELAHSPSNVRQRVIDPERGLLLFDDHFRFLGGVSLALNVELVSMVRRVEPSAPADPYEVPLIGPLRTSSLIGQGQEARGVARLQGAAIDRDRRSRGNNEQRWFRHRATDAVEALRALVGPAKGGVFLCDPYFGGEDLLRVVAAIRDPATVVEVLASAMHLKRPRLPSTEGEHLAQRMQELGAAHPANPVEVRVMEGHRPTIHDRFLLAGEKLWMLGASINGFGKRGTLMVIVPDPKPVTEDLKLIWDSSPRLTVWLAKRPAGSTP
jgi:hypothetical protein